VDYVVVDGRTVQAEGGAAIIDKGAGDAAFDGLNVIAGQQAIYWNGALRFVVGSQASAACYDANGNMTWRLQDGVAYEQTWDYENRLASVTDHATGQTTTFTYDGNGALVKKVDAAGTTVYVGSHYEVQSLGGKKTRDVTQLKNGVACQDGATGTGYILYSAENVHSRFAAHPPHADNADHFLCVRYSGGWQYDNNSAYYSFTPRSSDVLVAAVDFTNDTVTSLAGQNSTLNGITYGYASGNLSFEANVYGGVANPGEFYLTGTSLTTHSGGASVLKYYFFNGQRIAMRQDGVVQYLLSDHLGSTSLALDGSGNKVTESRYFPYGSQRWTADGTLPTDYRFTGARQESGLGLYQMGARWYDPALSRWLSADTLVPEGGNPQALNRYSYVLGNPLRYTDPLGLFTDEAIKAYLQATYEDWEAVWEQWQADESWMALLHAAQAGDILTLMHETGLRYFQFTGQGEDVLEGIMESSDIVGSKTWSGSDLRTIQVHTLSGSNYYRIGVFRRGGNGLIAPYLNPDLQIYLHTVSEMESLLITIWFAWPIGVLTFAAPWTVANRLVVTVVGTGAGVLGPAALLKLTGNKEGDQKLFIQLAVSGPYFYNAQIVVRSGEVVVDEFSFATPDMFPECTCYPSCP